VLNTLFGDSANINNRLRRLLQEKVYLDSAKSLNVSFSDNGLFGVQVSGAASKGAEILEGICTEVKKLRDPISNEVKKKSLLPE
jgi:hypothetical protein